MLFLWQIMSTSSSCADKRRSRYSRPSVNSVGANEEDPSGSAEVRLVFDIV